MARPAGHDDLEAHEKLGDRLFSWDYELGRHPEIETHIVAAKLAAKKLGHLIENTEVRAQPTVEQLDARIAQKQERWDRGSEVYDRLLRDEVDFTDLSWAEKNAAQYYAERENVLAPEQLAAASENA